MKNALSLTISMLAIGLSSAAPTYAADEADSITAAISGGDASVALRYRYEYVNQDETGGGTKEANASTLKTRVTYKTLPYKNLSGTLQFDNLSTVIEDGYNDGSGINQDANQAAIVDATYTEVNQAYLDYAAPADTVLRYGRQAITMDNLRFVGGVEWRQNEQTYDAITLINKSLPDTNIRLSHIFTVNNIKGGNEILGGTPGKGNQLFHINNKSVEGLSLSAYAYLLENQNDTIGIRATGKVDLDQITALYTAEYASQETDDAAENEMDYINLEAGLKVSGITAKLGYESLGSDDGNASFSTPLATKHKFNGWADMFLATPAQGLVDSTLTVSTKEFGPKIAVIYHQFDSDEGSIDFGSEIDLVIAKKLDKNYSGLLKFASFSEGDTGYGKPDTNKVWLQLLAKF